MKPIKAWHFVSVDAAGRPVLHDGRPVVVGEWIVHDGPVELCRSGLHASRRLLDALHYASGTTLCRVECTDVVAEAEDKLVCRRRRVLWWGDAEEVLGVFARWCALDVAHLWDCPSVAREFLETGDESLREDAATAAEAAWATAAEATWTAAAWTAAAWAAATAAEAAWATAAEAAEAARQNRALEQLVQDIVIQRTLP